MTWQDVSLLAGKYSEQKHVVYCNISLRPLFVNQPSTTTDADPFAENTPDEDHQAKKKTEVEYVDVREIESVDLELSTFGIKGISRLKILLEKIK